MTSGARLICVLAALPALAVAALAQASQTSAVHVVGGDPLARKLASKIVRPRYPEASVLAGVSGPAVALIEIAPGDSVSSITVLQAPDAAIGSALVEALKQWRFRRLPVVNGKRLGAFLTVVYYFDLAGSRPRVLAPSEAPVVGPGKESRGGGG